MGTKKTKLQNKTKISKTKKKMSSFYTTTTPNYGYIYTAPVYIAQPQPTYLEILEPIYAEPVYLEPVVFCPVPQPTYNCAIETITDTYYDDGCVHRSRSLRPSNRSAYLF